MFKLYNDFSEPKWISTESGGFKRVLNTRSDSVKDIFAPKKPNSVRTSDDMERFMAEYRRQQQFEQAEKTHMTELRKKQTARLMENEIEFFSSLILSLMKDFSDEQIRVSAIELLENEELYEKAKAVYKKKTISHVDDYDSVIIVRQSIIKIIEDATSRIERSHMEFPQINVAKTMSK
ncbi:MAG: hypothetical protein IKE75_05655 [Bacilli bacterium]|nr:hypothetical protein [Bacilli bacterium]